MAAASQPQGSLHLRVEVGIKMAGSEEHGHDALFLVM